MNDRLQFIAQSIAKAKKVMDKVDSMDRPKGGDDHTSSKTRMRPVQPVAQLPYEEIQEAPEPVAPRPRNNTKIPSAIAESFRQNPGIGVVDTSNPFNPNGFQMDALAGAVKQAEGSPATRTQRAVGGLTPEQRRQLEEKFNPTNQFDTEEDVPEMPSFSKTVAQTRPQTSFTQQYNNAGPVLSEDYVKFLIEQTIEKTVKATVEAVMAEITKPTSIDENIQIRIGGKTFGGKIKTLKS